jgi:hypothetical protein
MASNTKANGRIRKLSMEMGCCSPTPPNISDSSEMGSNTSMAAKYSETRSTKAVLRMAGDEDGASDIPPTPSNRDNLTITSSPGRSPTTTATHTKANSPTTSTTAMVNSLTHQSVFASTAHSKTANCKAKAMYNRKVD